MHDRILHLFAERRSRRAALAGGMAAAGAAAATRFRAALAQDGTPIPVAGVDEKVMFLFTQAFESGTWTPNADGTFFLAVSGGIASTIYFSDRPERVFGVTPTQAFLDGLGFSPANPPNAAIVVTSDDVEDIVLVELFDPVYDPTAGTLTYTVTVLDAYDEEGLGDAAARKPEDNDLPAQFAAGALFIDDCMQGMVVCGKGFGPTMDLPITCCYVSPNCVPCTSTAYLNSFCAQQYPGTYALEAFCGS